MKDKQIIGFTCGTFDLTHAGHYLMFAECKKRCDLLIVGLQIDPSVDRKDKHKPVQTLDERLIQLHSCKYIDEVLIYTDENDLVELLTVLKPDIRFIGADWRDKEYTGKGIEGIEVRFNSRDHNYSSSSLRERVIKANE